MTGARSRAVALAVVVALAAVGAALPTSRALVVRDAETGRTLLTVPVSEGSVVVLSYTHSVEKSPVEDVYRVRGDALDMTSTRFESYGWGLPAGADVHVEDGAFVYDPDWSGRRLRVATGYVAQHRLTVDGREYDLVDLADGGSVVITVERRSAVASAFAPSRGA
ncbi:MAG: DUF1850 domain-containing protein [Haloarculaceae archaeon]